MNTTERSLLLVWFVVVLVVLVATVSPVFGILGAVGGVVLGLPVSRSRALRGRGGSGLARRGVDVRRIGTTIGGHLVVLLAFVLVAAVVPGLRDRFVALLGAAVTAAAATVTAGRLRRKG